MQRKKVAIGIVFVIAGTAAYLLVNMAKKPTAEKGASYIEQHQISQFDSYAIVYGLEPATIKEACGEAEREMNGIVMNGDGVRDLHYQDSSAQDLVLRFVGNGEDGVVGLGGWEKVNAPEELGSPLEPSAVLSRLPCLKDAQVVHASAMRPRSQGGLDNVSWRLQHRPAVRAEAMRPLIQLAQYHIIESFRSPIIDRYPAPIIDRYPAPIIDRYPAPIIDRYPAPTIDRHQMTAPSASDSGHRSGAGDSVHPPRGGGYSGSAGAGDGGGSGSNGGSRSGGYGGNAGGSGEPGGSSGGTGSGGAGAGGPGPGGGEPPSLPRPFMILCPSSDDSYKCSAIDGIELASEFTQAIHGRDKTFFNELVDRLGKQAGLDIHIVHMPPELADRSEVIKAIVKLDLWAINTVTAKLQSDIRRLTPFHWDSPLEAARRQNEAVQHSRMVVRLWKAAAEQARPSRSFTPHVTFASSDNDHGSRSGNEDNSRSGNEDGRESGPAPKTDESHVYQYSGPKGTFSYTVQPGESTNPEDHVTFNTGDAFRQLVNINNTGSWGPN